MATEVKLPELGDGIESGDVLDIFVNVGDVISEGQDIIEMEYAVRGPIPQRAAEMREQGKTIIPCNIGNPQALGQSPISFYRQVLSLIEEPSRIERETRLKRQLGERATPSLAR